MSKLDTFFIPEGRIKLTAENYFAFFTTKTTNTMEKARFPEYRSRPWTVTVTLLFLLGSVLLVF